MNDLLEKLKVSAAEGFLYVLLSEKDDGTYTGSTRNLIERFKDHQNGKVKSTKGRCPLKLIYFEEFDDYESARKREIYLKTGAGRDWLKNNVLNKLKPVSA